MKMPQTKLVVLLLLTATLALSSGVSGQCCFSGSCSKCSSMADSSHFCGASAERCKTCGGTYCSAEPGGIEPTPAPVPTVNNLCCFDAALRSDMCGTCHSGAEGEEWCAVSQGRCQTCGGKWCPRDGSATVTTKPPSVTTTVFTKTMPRPPTTTPNPTATNTRSSTATTTTEKTTTERVTPSSSSTRATTTSTSKSSSIADSTWVEGTYVTGYWDCCKPSCSWNGKGKVTAPVKACKADGTFASPNDASVCVGGVAASCTNNQPWQASATLSYGFTAAAVSGTHGLTGDANCGQCYELKFTSQIHNNGNWGGSHPDLVGKSHIVQVTNIGYDVNGEHSFDLQIPGAGQGAFTSGCPAQFGGKPSGDFDCDNNYGGCDDISGCARLPKVLQKGCEWRYDFFKWLVANGKSNNPYIRFRRVRCPKVLTDISGSIPLDDDNFPAV